MKRLMSIFGLALLALAIQAPAAASAGTDEIPDALREQLKLPVAKKIKELAEEKNDLGVNYIFGDLYNDFTPAGDGYNVTFIKRIANPDELIAERYTMNLQKEGSGWKIADEKLEQRVEGLVYRSVPRDETFHAFDSVAFDREGLKVSGGKGELMVDYRQGEPAFLSFHTDGLAYSYLPPVDLGYFQHVLKSQMEKFPKDIAFDAEYVSIACSPNQCKALMAEMFQGLRETSYDQLGSYWKAEYDEYVEEIEKSRKESGSSGFRLIDRPGAESWSVSVKKKGKDHWATLSYDNERRDEMRFSVTALGDLVFRGFPLFVYNSEATRKANIDPYEIEQRPDEDQLDYDIVGLAGSVDLAVKDDEMMSCDFTYELKAKRDLPYLPFLVAQGPRLPSNEDPPVRPTLDVFVLEDGEGHDLTYVRLGRTLGLIVFPEIVPAGQNFKIHVKFDNGKSIYKYNHTYSSVSREGWAPFVSFTDKIDYFDLTISADAKYQILGIDNQISARVENGRRIERYRSDFPLTFPTIIFGDYESDVSSVEAKKPDGTPIPVRVFVDKTSMRTLTRTSADSADQTNNRAQSNEEKYRDERQRAQADVNIGVRDIRGDALRPIADQAANAINLYQEVFGIAYPFAKMDLVSDPISSAFYGQAPPSIVYLGFGVFYPTARVNLNSRGDISSFQNTVVAHELGHQWWGSAVVNKNFGNYWFVETLAEYSSALYSEALGRFESKEKDTKKAAEKGWVEYMKNVDEWRRVLLNRPNLYMAVQHADQMFPGGDPGSRQAAIYNKGPYAFHMMRLLFGEEKFFAFLKTLAQESEGKEIVTRDIQRIAERALCGTDAQGNPCSYDLEWFFDQWIRGVGMPEYSFHYTYRQAEDATWIVEGNIKQRVVIGADKQVLPGEVFRGRTTITVVDKKGEEYTVPVVIDAEITPFAFKVPKEPLDVLLNKNGGMLARDVLVNRDF